MALLMLSYASVQAATMQLAMGVGGDASSSDGAGASAMSAMAGMDMAAKAPRAAMHSGGHAPATKACPYCSAAAHPPIVGTATPLRTPSAFSFAAFRVVASHGPRGPPDVQPRARGPPSDP